MHLEHLLRTRVILIFGLFIGAIAWNSAQANSFDLCSDPSRDADVCRQMKVMRSIVLTMDAERELAQDNFPLFLFMASEVESITTGFLVGSNFNSHLPAMNDLRNLSSELKYAAAAHSHNTFRLANDIRGKCMQCHSEENPRSGYPWSRVFRINWDDIPQYCNSDGRNPFICRHMHAMGSLFDYFYTATDAGKFNFDLAIEQALEIERIANLLLQFPEPFHEGGRAPLNDIISKTSEVVDLAMQRDVRAFDVGRSINRACVQCHQVQ